VDASVERNKVVDENPFEKEDSESNLLLLR
jgi:hypothetical protein